MSRFLMANPSVLASLEQDVSLLCDNEGSSGVFPLTGISTVSDPYIPEKSWLGKYVLPDGSVVKEKDIKVEGRFVEYGPEDVDFLLKEGAIKKHEETTVYSMDSLGSSFEMKMNIDLSLLDSVTDYTFREPLAKYR